MIIATRTLTLRESGADIDIPISIFAPNRLDDGSWRCRYDIGWPDTIRTAHAGGADSVQALLLALQMIGSELYTTNYHQEGRLFTDRPGDGYGFPVPVMLRDMLVGDDRKFL